METGRVTGRNAVEFLWEWQDGLFELARHPNQRIHYKKREALESLAGNRYFAPVASKSRGSKKEDVARVGNVLWADIDSLDGLDDRLQRLLPIRPSVVVYSGMKGFWVYLKLSEVILTGEIELLNQGLQALLDADHCWNRHRIARLPGSIHQDSGKRAEVLEFSGLVYSPADLAFLEGLAPRSANASLEPTGDAPSLLTSFPTEFPALRDELWHYIELSPRRGEGYDRSPMEQKIFTALAYQGWTDEEIITFANNYRLPRHLEEWAKHKTYSWTKRSLRKVRQHIGAHPPSLKPSISKSICMGSDTNGSYSHTDRHKALRFVTEHQTTKELIQTWRTTLPTKPIRQRHTGCSGSSAKPTSFTRKGRSGS